MKALVTGGAGFIGSHLVDALVARGDDVTVVDDLSHGRRENLAQQLDAGVTLHQLDVCERMAMRHVVATERPEVIFHLAAQIDVHSSVADPALDATVNVGGTVNLLEGARWAGRPRFVLASTGGAIYGDTERVPTPEEVPSRPISPYGQSKYAAEGYCDVYARLHQVPTVSLRLANVYGPRQDPHGEAGVVAIFASRLTAGRAPRVIGDGMQTRDYVYVADVVQAFLAAADSEVQGRFNVGGGRETSVLELLEQLKTLTDADVDAEFAPELAEGVRRSCLDCSRALTELGWSADTPLVDGLRFTLLSRENGSSA